MAAQHNDERAEIARLAQEPVNIRDLARSHGDTTTEQVIEDEGFLLALNGLTGRMPFARVGP